MRAAVASGDDRSQASGNIVTVHNVDDYVSSGGSIEES